jgi:hypothetical protein
MRNPALVAIAMVAGLTIVAASPRVASAQVPDAGSQPRLAVPVRDATTATIAQPGTATLAPATAEPAPAPAAASAEPPPVTAVSGPTGVTTVGGTAPAPTASTSQAATATRSYAASSFALTLDGQLAGWLRSVEGGTATSDVVVERVGADQVAPKHIGGVRYEDIAVVTDLQARPLTDWIAASWKASAKPMNGTVQFADYNGVVVSEREFQNALIAETTLPVLDAASTAAAQLTVKLAPEITRLKPASGAKVPDAKIARTQKRWVQNSFRFEMNGLDGNKVNKIDSFTVRQTVAGNPVGELRVYEKEPGQIQFPNLRITLAASSAATWDAWFDDFVVKGNNGEAQERSGAIVYLEPVSRTELGRVDLSGCGIYRLAPLRAEAGTEAIQRVVAELYCERMDLVVAK